MGGVTIQPQQTERKLTVGARGEKDKYYAKHKMYFRQIFTRKHWCQTQGVLTTAAHRGYGLGWRPAHRGYRLGWRPAGETETGKGCTQH